jgi:transcriptional regulator with AAA-type ATPase domain
VKGSFTGAYRDKKGKIQLAHRGTLFLDEVGEMSLRMQALLLRFLGNGEIQAVGSDQPQARASTSASSRRPTAIWSNTSPQHTSARISCIA